MYTNNQKKAADKYKHQSIMTASPEELTLMLYNRCIKDIKSGIEYIDQNNIEKRNETLKNAQRIINHLRTTLDKDMEISKNMDNLYEYIYNLLINGNIKEDVEKLQEAKSLVEEFRQTWYQAMKEASKEGVKVV